MWCDAENVMYWQTSQSADLLNLDTRNQCTLFLHGLQQNLTRETLVLRQEDLRSRGERLSYSVRRLTVLCTKITAVDRDALTPGGNDEIRS